MPSPSSSTALVLPLPFFLLFTVACNSNNGEGKILYHHSAGHQTISPTSPPLAKDATFELGSAGKFLTHLAALRLVDAGATSLDAPVKDVLHAVIEIL